MKKLLVIAILGLLLSGNAFSKTISSYEDLEKVKTVLLKWTNNDAWSVCEIS
tara:strand:- start:356 stop:511 length:156 start_codon:yes stop_codon:yes gene_type:complete